MNSINKLDVILSSLTAFAIVAGGSLVTIIGSQAGGTAALNKTAWIMSGLLGLVSAAKDARSSLKLPPMSPIALAAATKAVALAASKTSVVIALLFLVGCVSATATRTNKDGSTSSIKVTGFLENVAGGTYTSTNSDGTSTTLAVANATPDQQSIAILAGSVADIAKSAMLLSKPAGTNTVNVTTNAVGNLIITPPPT